ncbi:hypothetical protein [Nonomuraea sp. NPDC003201]
MHTIDLAYVGRGPHEELPTVGVAVGVAVDPTHIPPDDPAVQAVVRAHRRALRVIHDDPDTAVRHIRTFLGRHTADEARAHYETFIAPYFTTEGQADLAVAPPRSPRPSSTAPRPPHPRAGP